MNEDGQLRALATEIARQTSLGFDPASLSKGIITAIDREGDPVTLTVKISGDTQTSVEDVRLLNNFSPEVNMTVLLVKQGPDLLAVGHIANADPYSVSSGNGWIQANLAGGSHGGNGNGDVYYRRILDHGSWKMQWRGGWDPDGGTTLVSALAEEYRPSSRRSVLAARQVGTGAVAVQFDFNTNGSVTLVGRNTTAGPAGGEDVTTSNNSAPTIASGGPTTTASSFAGAFTDTSEGHQHVLGDIHDHDIAPHSHTFTGGGHTHTFDVGSHSHQVSNPTWVSLNGVEYFL